MYDIFLTVCTLLFPKIISEVCIYNWNEDIRDIPR